MTAVHSIMIGGPAEPLNTERLVLMQSRDKRKPGRPWKEGNTMTATPAPETASDKKTIVRKTTMKLFDLTTFDNVQLVKMYTAEDLPSKPTTVQEALDAVGNDTQVLLSVIYEGLCERQIEQDRKNPQSFRVLDEEDEPGELFTGTPVTEAQGKAINGMVLNLAKVQGFAKGLDKKVKQAMKETAIQVIRDSPAILKSIVGDIQPPAAQ
jgi:hypothetical protein